MTFVVPTAAAAASWMDAGRAANARDRAAAQAGHRSHTASPYPVEAPPSTAPGAAWLSAATLGEPRVAPQEVQTATGIYVAVAQAAEALAALHKGDMP